MDLTSGYPYSLIINGIPSNFPELLEPVKTEVVIIGGGISGALTAFYLISAGIPCILVDKRTIGLGSTCASTSLLQYELDIPLSKLSEMIGLAKAMKAYQLCYEAIDVIHSISSTIGFKGFKRQQSLFYGISSEDKKMLQKEYQHRKQAGFKVEFLDESDMNQQFGFKASSAILSSKSAVTDAYMFTYALLEKAIKNGLKVFDRTEIVKIEYSKRSVQLVSSKGKRISAKKIVNASGYEIAEFVDKKIVKLYSTYAVASEHLQPGKIGFPKHTLLWNTANPYLYMRETSDDRIIVGGRDEKFHGAQSRDKLIKRKTALLKNDFQKLFPSVTFVPEFSWAGTFGSTKDSLPYIGLYSRTPHTYYALGFGGNGIVFSVIAAEIICNMILGKAEKNLALFSFNR